MTYKPIIYDEEEIGNEVYKRGYVENFGKWELVSLAKYFRYALGFGDAKIKSNLNSFLSKNPGYNYYRMRSYIGKIINDSRKEYSRTGSVDITLSELNFIRTIKNFKKQKILLGLLFLSKRKTNNGYVKLREWAEVKSLFSSAKIVSSEIEDVVRLIYQDTGKIVPTGNEEIGASHKILFIDNDSKIVFHANNEREARGLGNMYRDWCGGELYWCKDCQTEFIKTGRTHYYCDKCSKERELMKHRRYNKKRISHNDVLEVD